MRVKRRDAEQWMSHRLLPDNLRKRIRRYEQYKWQETRGVNEENLLSNLPKDLRRDIKRHLCLALVMRVTKKKNSSPPLFKLTPKSIMMSLSRSLCLSKWTSSFLMLYVTVCNLCCTQRKATSSEKEIL